MLVYQRVNFDLLQGFLWGTQDDQSIHGLSWILMFTFASARLSRHFKKWCQEITHFSLDSFHMSLQNCCSPSHTLIFSLLPHHRLSHRISSLEIYYSTTYCITYYHCVFARFSSRKPQKTYIFSRNPLNLPVSNSFPSLLVLQVDLAWQDSDGFRTKSARTEGAGA